MGIFDLFKKKKTLGDEFMEASTKMYRSVLPSDTNLTDENIMNIAHEVIRSFKKAAEEKEDRIPGGYLLNIAAKFLVVYDKFGEKFYYEHLNYEISKYLTEGLREDYQQNLF